MFPSPSPRDLEQPYKKVVDLFRKALESLELEPRPIPPRRIDSLRGGVSCFELTGKAIDAAVLLSRSRLENLYARDSEAFFRVDYAVRGNIRGILSGRIVSKTALRLKGLVRKSLEELQWELPSRDRGLDTRQMSLRARDEGVPPGPGELWEGGPHQKLTEMLNQDPELVESLESFVERRRGRFLKLSIISDRWGASIRVRGNMWLESPDFLATYATPTYLGIVDKIGGHIKEVRRAFGGIAF